jgi:hypothetical protein
MSSSIRYEELKKTLKNDSFIVVRSSSDLNYGMGVIVHYIDKNRINIIDKYSGKYHYKTHGLGSLYSNYVISREANKSEIEWILAAEKMANDGDIFRKRQSKGTSSTETNSYSII